MSSTLSQLLAVLDIKYFISIFLSIALLHFDLYCTSICSIKTTSVIFIYHDTLKIYFFPDLIQFYFKAACLESGSVALFYSIYLFTYESSFAFVEILLISTGWHHLELISFSQFPVKIGTHGDVQILIISLPTFL